jgi:cytoskeletal protein CcmA (bactofilin family)
MFQSTPGSPQAAPVPPPDPSAGAKPAPGPLASPPPKVELPREAPRPNTAHAAIGRGSRVVGKLFFDGTARIDGRVEGEISAEDTLVVGEQAIVTAAISGSAVVIRGRVTGDIQAKKRVELHPPGVLYGNVVTPSLVIHEGVVFEGHCSMGGQPAGGKPEDGTK